MIMLENGNTDFECNRTSDTTLKCTWLQKTTLKLNEFTINGAKITNMINLTIKGINDGNGTIVWHKGPHFLSNWNKQGMRAIFNRN